MTSQNAEADCCDRAQELTDKIPPCTRQYILQMFTGSYRDSQGHPCTSYMQFTGFQVIFKESM